jgi:cytochrome P450
MQKTPFPGTVPGAWPLLGHAPALLRDPLPMLRAAPTAGGVLLLRLGPARAYLVSDAGAIRDILTTRAASFDKGFQFDKLRLLIGDGVGTSTGSKHRRHRQMMRPVFDRSRVEAYVASLTRAATDTVDGWTGGQHLDAVTAMQSMTMTMLIRTLFDTEEAVSQIAPTLPLLLDGIGRRVLLPVRFLEIVPTPGNRRFDRARRDVHRIVDQLIREDKGDGLVSSMLGLTDDHDERMTDAEIHDEVMTILLAGTETSAGTLAWALHVLASHPSLQRDVQDELDAVTGQALPEASQLAKLPLLNRVIAEVLRMYPPGWILGRRPTTDLDIAGIPVRRGSQVMLNFYGLHRNSDVYPDPDHFDPDRWLAPSPAITPASYLPFGMGPHACIGEHYAAAQIRVVLAVMLGRFEVAPFPGRTVRARARTTLHPDSVPLTLKART